MFSLKLLEVLQGLRRVREAGRVQILQKSSKSDFMAPSYDQEKKTWIILRGSYFLRWAGVLVVALVVLVVLLVLRGAAASHHCYEHEKPGTRTTNTTTRTAACLENWDLSATIPTLEYKALKRRFFSIEHWNLATLESGNGKSGCNISVKFKNVWNYRKHVVPEL